MVTAAGSRRSIPRSLNDHITVSALMEVLKKMVEGEEVAAELAANWIMRLVAGDATREAAADWAVKFMNARGWDFVNPALADAMDLLAMIDSRHDGADVCGRYIPGGYMFDLVELSEINSKLRRTEELP